MAFIGHEQAVKQVEGILFRNKVLQEQVVKLTEENASLQQELKTVREEVCSLHRLLDRMDKDWH